MSDHIEKLSDIELDDIDKKIEALLEEGVCEALKYDESKRELQKKDGLYEDDIIKILEDRVLKHFDAYTHTDIFDILAFKDEGFWGLYLVGFEIKSDRDQPIRIFEQLPQYVYICDAVYLVLGEKVSIPKNLPSWVGVLKVVGNDVKLIKYGGARLDLLMQGKSLHIHLTGSIKKIGCSLRGKMKHYMTKQVLPNYKKHTHYLPSPEFFYDFLKKWFIISLFRDKVNLKFDTAEIVMLEALANYFRSGARQKSLVEFEVEE